VELPTLIITITSLSLTALGAFFVYRQTSLAFIKDERDGYRDKCEDCERELRSLRNENRYLLDRLRRMEEIRQVRRSVDGKTYEPES
jgi:chromosome segregation ATPase